MIIEFAQTEQLSAKSASATQLYTQIGGCDASPRNLINPEYTRVPTMFWKTVMRFVILRWLSIISSLVSCTIAVGNASADVYRFAFASVGTSYSAAMFAGSPLIGLEVTGARVLLEVNIDAGDAANFLTDLAMPIEPDFGNTNVVVLNGDDIGWTGTGSFLYEMETDEFNGFLRAGRYGAATYGEGYQGTIVNGYVEVDVPDFLIGDFNTNQKLDAADIDLLSDRVRLNDYSFWYDLNSDNLLDDEDRRIWVEEKAATYFGDANLDGEFNSSDFVTVFQAAEYEDGIKKNSTWATGDWNGDQDFDSSDFVLAFQSGGFEQGPRPVAAASVPEPTGKLGVVLGLFSILAVNTAAARSRRRKPTGR
ncbi:MAG: hypothetical protein KDB27_17500 [Planctomycetales bacterium]|nr:hypothetical protein [Planctomycetales bacterium]